VCPLKMWRPVLIEPSKWKAYWKINRVLSHSFKNIALQRWNWVLYSVPTWSLDNSLSSNWIKDRIKNSLGWIDRVNQIYVECHYIKLIEASAKIQCFLTHFLPFERPLFCHLLNKLTIKQTPFCSTFILATKRN
jgi:hypothetical protein